MTHVFVNKNMPYNQWKNHLPDFLIRDLHQKGLQFQMKWQFDNKENYQEFIHVGKNEIMLTNTWKNTEFSNLL